MLYTSVWATEQLGKELIDGALGKLLLTAECECDARILSGVYYSSGKNSAEHSNGWTALGSSTVRAEHPRILLLPPVVPSISFEDEILRHIEHAWAAISGTVDEFLVLDIADSVV